METKKYSSSSQQLLNYARNESLMMRHSHVGSLHLFCAFCKLDDPDMKALFKAHRIDPIIRRQMRETVGFGKTVAQSHSQPYSPRVCEILAKADKLALWNNEDEIRPLYIFYALLTGGVGVALSILEDQKISIAGMVSELATKFITQAPDDFVVSDDAPMPFLEKYGRDLSKLARKGALGPVIGRKEEITRIVQILTMKKKNNPILLGEAGVGKTAVVEGLAQSLIENAVDPELQNLRIMEINVSALLAGTKYRGDFEERLQKILEEASANRKIVLFIDEIHLLMGAGAAGGSMDAANMMKPALARGDIRCIGATTMDEFRKYIEKDPALERRFQPVLIEEPTSGECIDLLRLLRPSYESHYKLKITEEAIRSAVEFSIRYLQDRRLPDKALDLIDQACAKKKLRSLSNIQGVNSTLQPLDREDVALVVAEWTGVPVNTLSRDEAQRLMQMESFLKQRVIGQDHVIKAVAHTIRLAKAGLANPNRPIGVFFFSGPTGVGKTELAKALSEFLFDDPKRLIRFDMSEYKESHSASLLVGAPPGYVGYDQEGKLSQSIRSHPYAVLLLDEFEKAHHDIAKLFLQVFGEGRMTDARGRRLDFTNAVIIMTSNFDARAFLSDPEEDGTPAGSEKEKGQGLSLDINDVRDALAKMYSKEFVGRIDKILVFNHLKNENIRPIIDKLLLQIQNRVADRGLKISLTDAMYDLLIERGTSSQFGVRELQRELNQLFLEPLSEALLTNRYQSGTTIVADVQKGKIVLK